MELRPSITGIYIYIYIYIYTSATVSCAFIDAEEEI